MAIFFIETGESGEINQRQTFVGFLGLYGLFVQIFRQVDKKFTKQMWEVHRKVCILELMYCSVL